MIEKDKNILVIVESPNKQKTVSSILKDLGYKSVRVVATIGHTTVIEDVKTSYKNTGIYPEDNFRVTYGIEEGKKKTVDDIREQAKWADIILIASDPDREGESIGWHIKELLKLKDKDYFRITYHSVTKAAIKEAIENPRKLDMQLCDAAEARQVVDKLVGYSLSPIAKTYVGAKSVGRCQSAGLKLVVDRENEIRNFKPEQYFNLSLSFEIGGKKYSAKYIGTKDKPVEHVKTQEEVNKIIKDCSEGKFIVTNITKKDKQESPKPPFCTATFQQEASSKINLKVADAMKCAQELFEGLNVGGKHIGIITYHRTDDTDLAEDFKPILKEYINSHYGKNSYNEPRKGKKSENDQEGHEAIRCVDPEMTPEKLGELITNNLLLKVYKLIWQRTIASAMPNAVISETNFLIENGIHRFMLTASVLSEAGYREVYSYVDEDDEKENNMKVKIDVGYQIQQGSLDVEEKYTKPKPRYTDATLVKEMQRNGIGRPSTFATIVSTILNVNRRYCELEDKYIVPTEKGIQLSAFLDRAFPNIINIDYTKEMEKDLDLIATGKTKKIDFLKEFFDDLQNSINNNKEVVSQNEQINCPLCGSPMVIRRSRFGKLFYGCSNYPKCNGIVNKI